MMSARQAFGCWTTKTAARTPRPRNSRVSETSLRRWQQRKDGIIHTPTTGKLGVKPGGRTGPLYHCCGAGTPVQVTVEPEGRKDDNRTSATRRACAGDSAGVIANQVRRCRSAFDVRTAIN